MVMTSIDPIEISGCAIIEDGKLLLLWKIKQKHYEFPGGKVEAGETPESTAIREAKEELGVAVDLVRYLGYKDFHLDGRHIRSHKFLAEIRAGQTPRITEPKQFRDLIWMPIQNYQNYSIAPNVKDFCEDFVEGKMPI